jgi:DNA-binding LytR/AlgR family response regulator
MRVILVDDEKTVLDELEYCLGKRNDIEIIATFTNPIIAIEEAKNLEYDAAFLDIDMPVLNGLNVAMELMESNIDIGIVFVTAFNDYAVKAFELNAVDYILKPIDKNRLEKSVEKLIKSQEIKPAAKKILIDKLGRIEKCIRQGTIKMAAYDDEEIVFVKMCDVLHFEATLGKTYMKTINRSYKVKDTLDTLEAKLSDYGFFRCHRSYIINLRHISKLSPMFNNNYILFLDGSSEKIPVSRNVIHELKSIMGIT